MLVLVVLLFLRYDVLKGFTIDGETLQRPLSLAHNHSLLEINGFTEKHVWTIDCNLPVKHPITGYSRNTLWLNLFCMCFTLQLQDNVHQDLSKMIVLSVIQEH